MVNLVDTDPEIWVCLKIHFESYSLFYFVNLCKQTFYLISKDKNEQDYLNLRSKDQFVKYVLSPFVGLFVSISCCCG